MSVDGLSHGDRVADYFSHIDMGFLNRRLAISALGPVRGYFLDRQQAGDDHMTRLRNDHLLVTMLIDVCSRMEAPTLAEALALGRPKHVFMSIERLQPCAEVYEADRVAMPCNWNLTMANRSILHTTPRISLAILAA